MNWKGNAFISGEEFPSHPIRGTQLVSSFDKQAFYTIGNEDTQSSMNMYKFSCQDNIYTCKWTKIDTELQVDRSSTVAIPITSTWVDKICN